MHIPNIDDYNKVRDSLEAIHFFFSIPHDEVSNRDYLKTIRAMNELGIIKGGIALTGLEVSLNDRIEESIKWWKEHHKIVPDTIVLGRYEREILGKETGNKVDTSAGPISIESIDMDYYVIAKKKFL